MCVLIFATNPCAKHPLLVALSETVEALSGSELLLTVVNRIGATVSRDTLDRFITTAAKRIIVEGPFKQLPPGYEAAFIAASTDNLDKGAPTSFRQHGVRASDMHVITFQIHCKKSFKLPESGASAHADGGVSGVTGSAGTGGETAEVFGRGVGGARTERATEEGLPGAEEGADVEAAASGIGGGDSPARNAEPMIVEDGQPKVRARTLMEGGGKLGESPASRPAPSSIDLGGQSTYQGQFTDLRRAWKTAEDVLNLSDREEAEWENLGSTIFNNMVRRERTAEANQTRASFRDELAQQAQLLGVPVEQSEIVYVATWPLKASNREEFSEALFKIKEVLEVGTRTKVNSYSIPVDTAKF